MGKSEKARIVEKYLEEYIDELKEFRMTKLGLARLIYQDYDNIFKDVEEVRAYVRRYTGASNNGSERNMVKLNEEFRFVSSAKQSMKAVFPKSLTIDKTPYIIDGIKKLLIFSDVHLPYHNLEAIETMFAYCEDKEIDGILINGDLLDFYGISRWDKAPDKPKMREEFEMAHEFFAVLREMFPIIPIIFKLGNHDARWEKYLISKAPELFGIPEFRLDKILKLDEHKITMIDEKRLMKFGKLNIIHGHEFGESTFSPVNAARGLFIRAKCNILAGHNHQSSEHNESNVNGENMACWSIGCLSELTPDYRPFAYTKWNYGFAIVTMKDESGNFSMSNLRIINGQVL